MIALRRPPRRADLRAFAITASLWLAAAGSVLWLVGSRRGAVLAIVAAAALGASGWAQPRLVSGVYRRWNHVALAFARWAQLWLTALAFGVVWAAGRAGSRAQLRRPAGTTSGWLPKRAAPVEAGSGWLRALLSLCRPSHNLWIFFLMPYLSLLGLVHAGEEPAERGNVYTLY